MSNETKRQEREAHERAAEDVIRMAEVNARIDSAVAEVGGRLMAMLPLERAEACRRLRTVVDRLAAAHGQ